ncbi:tetratricopeptide repeat protein [Herbidospora daliensis]|uniref:tetratricopeptide repeat protein n=1 Tax=Herbidospora daliensis TaxID=295585 RepID=UPI000781CE05|nr:hypothetical protein [Herbidospora daliensis]
MEDEYDSISELCVLEDYGQARLKVDALMEKYPDDPNPVLLSAHVHILQGDPRAARAAIDRAMIVSPDLRADHLALASWTFRLLGDVTQAISYGRRAVELDPDDPMANQALAKAYAADPARDLLLEAEHHAEKADEPVPDEPVEKPRSWTWAAALTAVVVTLTWIPVTKWLGGLIEDLLGVDRPPDRSPLAGVVIMAALTAAGFLGFRAFRIRRGGDRVGAAVQRWRAVSRELHLTLPGRLAIAANVLAAWLCFLPFAATMWLGFPVLDEGRPPSPGAAAAAGGVVAALGLLVWLVVRWWLGPGQTWRFLTAGWALRVYLPVTAGLMLTAIVMAAAQVTNERAWLVVTLLHVAWFVAALVPMLTRHQRTGR